MTTEPLVVLVGVIDPPSEVNASVDAHPARGQANPFPMSAEGRCEAQSVCPHVGRVTGTSNSRRAEPSEQTWQCRRGRICARVVLVGMKAGTGTAALSGDGWFAAGVNDPG